MGRVPSQLEPELPQQHACTVLNKQLRQNTERCIVRYVHKEQSKNMLADVIIAANQPHHCPHVTSHAMAAWFLIRNSFIP